MLAFSRPQAKNNPAFLSLAETEKRYPNGGSSLTNSQYF